jgi:hypothetical protein
MPSSKPPHGKASEQPRVKVHAFGGLWTERKLAALEGYLTAYRHIFDKGPWASKYKTIYVDGFAGTGERTDIDPDPDALTGNPLYMLCFAAGSKAGAPIAVRIAKHLLRE